MIEDGTAEIRCALCNCSIEESTGTLERISIIYVWICKDMNICMSLIVCGLFEMNVNE